MSSFEKTADHPFVAEGGVAPQARYDEDPLAVLDDLMVVVETLCPVWPQRETFASAGEMLL